MASYLVKHTDNFLYLYLSSLEMTILMTEREMGG